MKNKEKLKKLEKAIHIGANALYPPKIMTTCPFCFAKLIGIDNPTKCPHCNTKFEEGDDLQLKTCREIDEDERKKSWLDKALKPEVRL